MVDLNVINHSNKYRIKIFWEMFVIMQDYIGIKSF